MRTTIVGGRPPGSGRAETSPVPRGIEVLVKKAAVDPEFCELLLQKRGGAAAAIQLELDPNEHAILRDIPRSQLAQVVRETVVPMEQRRAFLGRVAAAMLGVIGAGLAGCGPPPGEPAGIQPDRPSSDTRPSQPTNESVPAVAGVQSVPAKPQPASNPPAPAGRGISPDRP